MAKRNLQTPEWEETRVNTESGRLIAANKAVENITTSTEQQIACERALNGFAQRTWPDGMDELMFPSSLRQKLAERGARITSIDSLRQNLRPEFLLDTSSLKEWAEAIVAELTSAIENNPVVPRQRPINTPAAGSANPDVTMRLAMIRHAAMLGQMAAHDSANIRAVTPTRDTPYLVASPLTPSIEESPGDKLLLLPDTPTPSMQMTTSAHYLTQTSCPASALPRRPH